MERQEKEIGRFILNLRLFEDINGQLIPEFNSKNLNMPNDIIIAQLRTFIKIIENIHCQDFRGNAINIYGKPEE